MTLAARLARRGREVGTLLGLVALSLLLSALTPHFLTVSNLLNVMEQTSINAVIAVGMTYVIISGGIDLSVGSLLALSGVLLASGLVAGLPPAVAILLGLAAGATGGLANGLLVTWGRLPPFIATLGTLGIYRGLTLLLTDGIPVANLTHDFGVLATGTILRWIPLPLVFVLVTGVLVHLILNHTKMGRYSYAIGSNREAARCCGIQIGFYTVMIYGLGGALTGLAGMIEAARLVTGQPTAGDGYELRVIAAVVIGGGSLSGGQGTVLGTIVGSLIMGLLSNGCNLLGISPFLQQVIIGSVIVLAVSFDELQKRRAG